MCIIYLFHLIRTKFCLMFRTNEFSASSFFSKMTRNSVVVSLQTFLYKRLSVWNDSFYGFMAYQHFGTYNTLNTFPITQCLVGYKTFKEPAPCISSSRRPAFSRELVRTALGTFVKINNFRKYCGISFLTFRME